MRRLGLAVLLWAGAGCATFGTGDVQRATEGPTAEEIFVARFVAGYNRQPTFDETANFRADMDERISDYFSRRPDSASSPRASQIRSTRRVSVGMTRNEVLLLAGEPLSSTQDRGAMQEAAKASWPLIRERAQEMWAYPGNWRFYFDGNQLVDLTYVGHPPQ